MGYTASQGLHVTALLSIRDAFCQSKNSSPKGELSNSILCYPVTQPINTNINTNCKLNVAVNPLIHVIAAGVESLIMLASFN